MSMVKLQINGKIIDSTTRQGLEGLLVEAWDRSLFFKDLVGAAVTDESGQFTVDLTDADMVRMLVDWRFYFEKMPDVYFKVYRGKQLIRSTEDSVLWNSGVGETALSIEVEGIEGGTAEVGGEQLKTYTVTGTVTSSTSPGVGGLRVQLVDKNIGPDVLLGETTTDIQGRYELHAAVSAAGLRARRKTHPDLQVRVLVGDRFLAASDIKYNASTTENLDVALPADAAGLPSEYETLTAHLATFFDHHLGALREDDERQDITYLANKTGWDARAVAMAALADQFSRRAAPKMFAASVAAKEAGIKPAFYYALFRAGFPADAESLYQANAKTVAAVWEQAIKQGVISSALANEIPKAAELFEALSAVNSLDVRPAVGVSTLKEMLHDVLGDDPQQVERFASLYVRHQDDMPTFWSTLEAELGEAKTKRLRLDGQLGYLTMNHAPLIRNLHETERENPLTSTLDLAKRGYYEADKWLSLLDGAIPPNIPGETDAEKRKQYAELLAAQVRLAFPTAVIADRVQRQDLPIPTADGAAKGVYDFLTSHQGQFEIGVEPVERYLARNALQEKASVVAQIKRLQRVYQITPNDQALAVLLHHDLDSAYAITHRHDQASFVRAFGDTMGEESARQVYAKATQVHGAVLNIATSYLTARIAPPLGALPLGANEQARVLDGAPAAPRDGSTGVIAYPTLEDLFGSMDYCPCDECRSILSPAAYLVDLLHFIDRPSPQSGFRNPQDVLFERRPDLLYLALTCENTNVPLPYIDLVNETLEYVVAHGYGLLSSYHGHDTDGSVSSDELMANPQFVNDLAYAYLKWAKFPLQMPFHRPLELLRLHFQKLGVRIQDAIAVLTPAPTFHLWWNILIEEIGFSDQEGTLLIDSSVKLQDLYGYPSDADLIAKLSSVQNFSRRVGISYDDLISILQTTFINPNAVLIPRLRHLGVPFKTLHELKQKQNDPDTQEKFKALLPSDLDARKYGGKDVTDLQAVVDWVINDANYNRIKRLIVIDVSVDATDPNSAASLELCFCDPDNAASKLHPIDFVRLIRFIRLWRKLGLTIAQTDDIIRALYPPDDLPIGSDDAEDLKLLDSGFYVLLMRIGFLLQVMRRLNLSADRDLAPLLACWAPIGTAGEHSLYAKMFLAPTVLSQDPAFADDGYGNIFQDNTQLLLAGCDLRLMSSVNDVNSIPTEGKNLIIVANVQDVLHFRAFAADGKRVVDTDESQLPDKAPQIAKLKSLLSDLWGVPELSQSDKARVISGVTSMVGHTLLAHASALCAAFSLREAEFTLITTALGFDAFTLLTLENISAIYRRGWLAQTLRLSVVEFLLLIGFTGLDPFAPLDLVATTEPSEPPVIRLIRLLQALSAASFKPVQALYLIWNEDISSKLWGPQFSAGLTLARTLRASFEAVESQFSVGDDPNGDIAKARMALVYGTAATDLFFEILNNTVTDQKTKDRFFEGYPELLPFYQEYVASTDPPQTKRAALLVTLLRDIKQNRKQEQALAAVTAAAGTDPSFAAALLNAASVLHTVNDPALPAICDLTAIEAGGLYGQFYLTNDFHKFSDLIVNPAPLLDYAPGGNNPLPRNPTGGPIAGRWSGYLEVPQTGFYNIAITTDPGATCQYIQVDCGEDKVWFTKTGDTWTNTAPIYLTAGVLRYLQFGFSGLVNILTVKWKSTDIPWQVIPAHYLYSETKVLRLFTVYVRFLIATSLAKVLSLTAKEIAYMASNPDFFIMSPVINRKDGWLNFLGPSSWDNDTRHSLCDILYALLDFARIKKELSPSDESFLAILQNPAATLPNGKSALLTLTGWDKESLDALLGCLFYTTDDFSHLEKLRRVYDAYALVKTCGTSAATLIAATTNDPTPEIVTALQSALRARYAEADWLAVIKPINDTMRTKQRDALVAYILQQLGDQERTAHINTPDKLFELLLMDVEMEPSMATSRIRHALSSVQLFIEHCVRNLEPDVSPAHIDDANQWRWMKRYRVWQANREVFLWPENWLDPELRDDQSPFFKEALNELLQSDITDDAAQSAFLNYLTKLEEVAKLEPCGLYTAQEDPVKHSIVVARTTGAQRKYYFRRCEFDTWTPWQQIKLDIEDVPVIPFAWKDRLYLFWLKIVQQASANPEKPQPDPNDKDPISNLTFSGIQSKAQDFAERSPAIANPVRPQAILCWSEYYNGEWQSVKTSDPNRPTSIGRYPSTQAWLLERAIRPLYAEVLDDPAKGPMLVEIESVGQQAADFGNHFALGVSAFSLTDTSSLPIRAEDSHDSNIAKLYARLFILSPDPSKNTHTFTLDQCVWIRDHYMSLRSDKILSTYNTLRIIEPQPYTVLKEHWWETLCPWYTPFFFVDNPNVFYVTPSHLSATIADYDYFGLLRQVASQAMTVMIPPLVTQSSTMIQGEGGLVTSTHLSQSELVNIQRFISTGTNSRVASRAGTTVPYSGQQIGLSGKLTGVVNSRNRLGEER